MRALLAIPLLAACSTVVVAPLLPAYRDTDIPIASKADFDPALYAGRWYEVARFPVPFQRGCAGAIAEYGPPRGDLLSIRNTCLDAGGAPIRAIEGTARLDGPGRLQVVFDGVPFTAPYWVLWVDSGYRTAVVGQPDGRAGWILNRDPDIPPDRLQAALDVLDFNGYRTEELRFTTPTEN